jgi:hypothetical protein
MKTASTPGDGYRFPTARAMYKAFLDDRATGSPTQKIVERHVGGEDLIGRVSWQQALQMERLEDARLARSVRADERGEPAERDGAVPVTLEILELERTTGAARFARRAQPILHRNHVPPPVRLPCTRQGGPPPPARNPNCQFGNLLSSLARAAL